MDLNKETIKSIYKLATKAASRYKRYGHVFDREDFVQIGVMAAIIAMKRYDSIKGGLSTYLMPRIKGAMFDTLREYMGSRRKRNEYQDSKTVRFSQLQTPELDCTERIIDKKQPPPDYTLEITEELQRWKELKKLSKREWTLIKMRIGENKSQGDVGRALGFSCKGTGSACICRMERDLFHRLEIKSKVKGVYPKKHKCSLAMT